jgi:hypothetical protein
MPKNNRQEAHLPGLRQRFCIIEIAERDKRLVSLIVVNTNITKKNMKKIKKKGIMSQKKTGLRKGDQL